MDTDKELAQEIKIKLGELNALLQQAANQGITTNAGIVEYNTIGYSGVITKIDVELSKRLTF